MAYQRSQHENKFDRQMRLWGGHGQQRLESSHICIINSGPTATETLKNLVLPNVGAFTIVDDFTVRVDDVGNNFFVHQDSVGRSRAQIVNEWMHELNSDVKGYYEHKNIDDLINNNLSFFKQFHLIIACQLPELPMRRLSAYLYSLNIPLVVVKTYGLIGYARLQIKEHTIIESHPGNDRYDLYIHPSQLRLWPELQRYINSFLLLPKPASVTEVLDDTTEVTADDDQPLPPTDTHTHTDHHHQSTLLTTSSSSNAVSHSLYLNGKGLDSEEHAHIPYIAILGQLMQRWLLTHATPPSNYNEKQSFKQTIIAAAWDYANETNFAEAVEFAHRCYDLPTLDRQTQAIFNDPILDNLSSSSSAFWLLVSAVKRFVANEGGGICLPVSVDIPDMHSKTDWYVSLKEIFKHKSQQDIIAVNKHLHDILKEFHIEGRHQEPPSGLAEADVFYFCKHVRALRIIRTSSIEQEYSQGTTTATINDSNDNINDHDSSNNIGTLATTINNIFEEAAYDAMDAADNDNEATDDNNEKTWKPLNPLLIHWYLALRTAEQFYIKHQHYPGLLTQQEVDSIDHPPMNNEEEDIDIAAEEKNDAGGQVWSHEDMKEMIALLRSFYTVLGLTGSPDESTVCELTRYGACEPHVIAAYMGGQAAQISLKVLLHQYVPVNNTVLFNGIHCSSQSWNL